MMLITGCLVLAGCVSLALGQAAKWKLVTGNPLVHRTRAALRVSGLLWLGTALGIGIAVDGAGFAVLSWTQQVALASFLVAMVLGFRPRSLRRVARLYSVFWP